MNSTKPNSRRNLDISIDRLFGFENNTIQIRTLIANTIIGQMLPKGVVKGGSALKLRYGNKTTRFTRDLDTARAEDLEELGLPQPKPIPLMQIHHQISQKLHALSAAGSERAHDLIDLQIIKSNEKIDYNLTKESCKRLFAYRKQQKWPPVIVKGNNWDTLYNSQIINIDVLQNIDDAIDWVNGFIKMIDR